MYKNPTMYMLELKSTKGTSFSFSEKIIKSNQIKELQRASTFDGIIAGFVFNFRKYNCTYFIKISDFVKFKETCGKKSINKKDCEDIGILIKQTLKVTKYHYHIGEFIRELSEKLT